LQQETFTLALTDISDISIPAKARLLDRIREQIVTGAFPLGARLSDKDLAAEMNVSRTPVREALLQLQSEGLIVVRPRSGTFVFDVTESDLSQICEMRSLFETGALKMAAAVNPSSLVGALTFPVAEAALALEDKDYARCEALDTIFHETLIALSANKYLVESYRTISTKVRALRSRLPQNHARIEGAIAQHRRIIDLVAVGKAELAAAEITSHVRKVRTQLLSVTTGGMALKAAG
jgi:DNA-binding GntR family transcriptional regulator